MLVIRAGIHKIHVRTVNREDPDQTASSDYLSGENLFLLYVNNSDADLDQPTNL